MTYTSDASNGNPDKTDQNIVVGDDTNDNPRQKHRYELHNYTLRFDIIERPDSFSKGIVRFMKNWSYREITDADYNIRIMPKCILLFIRKRKTTGDPIELEQIFVREAIEYMKRWSESNGFRVSQPEIVNNEVKAVDYLIAENFRTRNFKSVYPIPSPLEFTNPSHAVKDSVKFISHIDRIEDALVKWSFEYEKHARVLDDMSNTMRAIQESLKKPTLLEWLKRLFK